MKNLFSLLIIGVFIALNVYISASQSNTKKVSLDFFGLKAHADSECGAGDSVYWKYPKTGAICTCNGQVVIPQTCESGGDDSCSPITCG